MPSSSLQGDVSGLGAAAVARRQRAQAPGQAGAGVGGLDDLVDEALAGGGGRRQVLVGVLGREPAPHGVGVVRVGEVAPAHDADGLLGPHHADLGAGPGEAEVRAQVLRVHGDVGAAIGLAQHDGQARHGRLRERVQELGPVADDATALLARAGQEAGRVDEHDQRQPVRVARAHEAGGLGGRVGVEDAAEHARLVGHDADRAALDARGLLAVFQTLLYRYTGQTDIIVGSPIASRDKAELEPLIGFFANMLALRGDCEDNPTFRELLSRTRETVLEAYAHQDLPFEKIVDEVQPERDLTRTPLFQVCFVFDSAGMGVSEFKSLRVKPIAIDTGTSKFDLTLTLVETGEDIRGHLQYNTDIFLESTISRMAAHFNRLVDQIVANPDAGVYFLQMLSQAERRQLQCDWNLTQSVYPRASGIQQIFEQQAGSRPQAIAVIDDSQVLSYGALNRRANQLARYLKANGVGLERLVGICMPPSADLIAGLLGILKAGAAYVPLDADYPDETLRYMIEDAELDAVLTSRALAGRWAAHGSQLLIIEDDAEQIATLSDDNPECAAAGDNLAYVMYTSGSTGRPKGVSIPHRGVVRLVKNTNYADLDDRQVLLQMAPISFDASIFEIWGAVLNGGRLVMMSSSLPSLSDIGEAVARYGVTTLWLTSALFKQMVENNLDGLRGLRQLLAGGDVLPPAHVERVTQKITDCRMINGYGPTENTTFTCCYQVSGRVDTSSSVPIGRPIANTQVFVVDANLELAPIGVPGELCIGGDGLGRHYHKRPDLTAALFIPNPFASRAGERLYRTGDVARRLADGNIEFIGRRDNQVKIRGFRVELEEIELALSRHEAVKQCVVRALRRDDQSGKYLAAYVAPVEELRVTANDLIAYLRERLPAYMVPATIVMLDALPLNSVGKVDRRALPAPETMVTSASEFEPPRGAAEIALAEIWKSVLRLARVGVHENFFELGGDSILSIQITARANEAGLRITPRQIFQHQTIAELAAAAGIPPTARADQGAVTGDTPLTPIQRWFFDTHTVEPHHFNQSVLLEVEQGLDVARLKKAFQHCLRRHDALRLSFTRDDNGWRQFIAAPDLELPFSLIDLSATDRQGAWIEAVANQTQASFDLSAPPLARVVFFRLGPGKPDRLLIVIHHLTIDIVSWKILIEDLQTSYEQLGRAETVDLPQKTTSFKQWAENLVEYARSDKLRDELDYWLQESRRQVAGLPVERVDVAAASYDTVYSELGEAQTRALIQEAPSAYRTRINDLLLAALAQSLAGWTGEQSFLIDLEGHGREEVVAGLDLTRTIGWFTTFAPVLLEVTDTAPAAVIKGVKEQLRAMPNHGIGHGLLRYLSGDQLIIDRLLNFPQAQVSFNYLGRSLSSRSGDSPLRLASEYKGASQSQRDRRSHPLEINAQVTDGKLRVAWTFSPSVLRRETVESLADAYLARLRELIGHCLSPEAGGYTPSDFPLAGLDQRKLDELFAKDRRIEDAYTLSPLQEGMLFHSIYEPQGGAYLAQTSCLLQGHIDVAAFERAWRQVIELAAGAEDLVYLGRSGRTPANRASAGGASDRKSRLP